MYFLYEIYWGRGNWEEGVMLADSQEQAEEMLKQRVGNTAGTAITYCAEPIADFLDPENRFYVVRDYTV